MALAPGHYLNFGDALERVELAEGVIGRLAARTGVGELRSLCGANAGDTSAYSLAKLAITVRNLAWADDAPSPTFMLQDAFLDDVGIAKLIGGDEQTPIIVAAVAGDTDGHHNHVHVGGFIVAVGTETLIVDPGRGKYTRDYFRAGRYANAFANAYGHSIPRIGAMMQQPGPAFGGCGRYYGRIVDLCLQDRDKWVVIDFHTAYDLPALTLARRLLRLDAETGLGTLIDHFTFAGAPLPVEEVFVTWGEVTIETGAVRIDGQRHALRLEAPGIQFQVEYLEAASLANERSLVLKRITAQASGSEFRLSITPILHEL